MYRRRRRPLRTELTAARAQYRHIRYGGDLAAELLPRSHPAASTRWWLLPLATAAIAATMAIALRHPTAPTAAVPSARTNTSIAAVPPTTRPARSALFAIADINYRVYVRDVDAHVRDSVGVLTGSIDRALSAPVVSNSVRKVDEVTDDLKHIATTTWSQLRTAPRPPC